MNLDKSLRAADKLVKIGEFNNAISIYKNILKKYPKNLRVYNLLNNVENNSIKRLKTNKDEMDDLINDLNTKNYELGLIKGVKLLEKYPKSSEIMNILGIIFHNLKKLDKAINFYKQAIINNQSYYPAYNNLGNAYLDQDDLELAKKNFIKAISLKENYFDAMNNLGSVFQKQLKFDDAIKIYEKIINSNPNYFKAHTNLGISYKEIGKFDKSLYFLKKSVQINPNYSEGFFNLGSVLQIKKQYNEAIINFKKALKINPNYYECMFNLGKLYSDIDQLDKSKELYQNVIKLNPNFYQAYNNLGSIYKIQGQYIEAINSYKKGIEVKTGKKDLIGILNIGICYSDLEEYNKALDYYDQCLSIDDNFSEAWNGKGIICKELDNFSLATQYFEKAIEIKKDYANALFNISLMQLHQMDFLNGWKNYNKRWEISEYKKFKINFIKPKLKYENLSKDKLFVWGEQGIGDQIFFSRNLRQLERFNNKVYCKIDDKIKPLFERSFPYINFVDEINEDEIDSHISIGDLSQYFIRNKDDVLKSSQPFLLPDSEKTKKIKNLLPYGKKIIGISWISKNNKIGNNKSLTLEQLKPILSMKDYAFVDLQYSDTSEERKLFEKKYNIKIHKINEIDNFNDLDGLSSLINTCDIVLSVSNTNVHLSAALGKKTFLMLPKGKGKLWYWTNNNKSSDWYSSIRIFEQEKQNDWSAVINDICKDFGVNIY